MIGHPISKRKCVIVVFLLLSSRARLLLLFWQFGGQGLCQLEVFDRVIVGRMFHSMHLSIK